MTQTGDDWLMCPMESRTLCWIAEGHEVAITKTTPERGIFACVAINDVGSQIALTNLVDPALPIEWQFALGNSFRFIMIFCTGQPCFVK